MKCCLIIIIVDKVAPSYNKHIMGNNKVQTGLKIKSTTKRVCSRGLTSSTTTITKRERIA